MYNPKNVVIINIIITLINALSNKALKHKFQNDIIYNNCFWSAYIEKFER